MENINYHEIVASIERNIIGRVANKNGDVRTDDVETVMRYVHLAGGGNHLEIGTLFGGSAIAVALLQEKMHSYGMVFCIDPLDGYYPQYFTGVSKEIDASGQRVSPDVLFRNITNFNVGNRIAVIRAYSADVIDLFTRDIRFATAYIDGDHSNGMPLNDWLKINKFVTKYVIFDNCDDLHPDVQNACRVANEDDKWEKVFQDEMTYVVQRIYK